MTEVTQVSAIPDPQPAPVSTDLPTVQPAVIESVGLSYTVAMPDPESHLFEVTLIVQGWRSTVLDLKMPVWTPGSYLIREYARHLQDFTATTGDRALTWRKISKNHWRVQVAMNSSTIRNGDRNGAINVPLDLTVKYRIYANDLTVRTNHLDRSHGYFNGAALFFFVPGYEQQPVRVKVVLPQAEWRVATALPAIADQPHTFEAKDFDTLVDSPFEVGLHQRVTFEVLGKPHEYAIWGTGNIDVKQMVVDTRRVIEAEAALFGGLPYDRYLFILHLSASGFGGLEHKDSCTLNYSRLGFRDREKYQRFIQLVAHEFFHLWNVKRIRPQALVVFDYERENYTSSLWFSEGTTSYYDLILPFRAGIYDAKTLLRQLSKEITRYLVTPGRKVQPLAESSFDAWIKLYRRDTNSDNSQISYYLKGEMVSLLLDLLIRARFHNQRSLDQVLQQLWQEFGQQSGQQSGQPDIGFTPEQLQAVITSISDLDLSDFFERYLNTTEELPFDAYLQPFGLQLKPEDITTKPPFLGMTVKSENGREMIKFVESGSPARMAGIDPDDELLAIDGLRVKAEQLSDRLKDYRPGDRLQIALFHQEELQTVTVTLAAPRPASYEIVAIENMSQVQRSNLKGWLGIDSLG